MPITFAHLAVRSCIQLPAMASRSSAKRKAQCHGLPPLTNDLLRWPDPLEFVAEGLEPGVRAIERWCEELGVDGKRKGCMIGSFDREFLGSLPTPNRAWPVTSNLIPNELRFLFRKHYTELLGWKQREVFLKAVDLVLREVVYPNHRAAKEKKRLPSEESSSARGSARLNTAGEGTNAPDSELRK